VLAVRRRTELLALAGSALIASAGGVVHAGTTRGSEVDAPAVCAGDCDDSGTVSIDELVTLVKIALGASSASACGSADADGDRRVTIDEIVAAVKNALDGCPTASSEFVDNGDGTVTDTHSGLMWEKKEDGSADLHDSSGSYFWGLCQPSAAAADACLAGAEVTTGCAPCDGPGPTTIWLWLVAVNSERGGSGFAGHSDWRLPSTGELQAIVPAASLGVLGATPADFYWSSETDRGDPSFAYGVNFTDGSIHEAGKPELGYVRAVRQVSPAEPAVWHR